MNPAGSVHDRAPERHGASAGLVLTPDDAHAVFRAVLDALARPGTVHRLPAVGAGAHPPVLLPVLAMATLDTPVALLGDEPDGRWRERVRLVTSASEAAPTSARLVAALRPATPDEVAGLARGSAEAPEEAALAAVPVEAVDGGEQSYELRGPGVDRVLTIAPHGWDAPLDAARTEATAAFPAGPDLLLIAPDGHLVGLPRSTRATPVHPPASRGEGRR